MNWGGVRDFSRKTSMRGHIEDLGVYGSILFNTGLEKIKFVAMIWLHPAQDIFHWRGIVHKVMKEICSSLGGYLEAT
jgi:hypothetical protein